MNLETGEALVSFLDEKGAPSMVERARILFPLSQIGAVTDEQRAVAIRTSDIAGKYDTPEDRVSAYEVLLQQAEESVAAEQKNAAANGSAEMPADDKSKDKKSGTSIFGKILKAVLTAVTSAGAAAASQAITGKGKSGSSIAKSVTQRATSAAIRTAANEITRGALGNLLK